MSDYHKYHNLINISSIRMAAYKEAKDKISLHQSLASQLTPEQVGMIENDVPFELGQSEIGENG